MKEQAIDNEALALAHSGTPEQRTKSISILRERDRKVPFDPIVLLELARYDEEHGKPDAALKDYAKLAVLPMFDEVIQQVWKTEKDKHPSPRKSAEKLWKGLHGGKTDGFDKYLDDVYAQSMPKFDDRPVEPRPADPENRVVLCELFTGASCGYCVAADVAFAHLIKIYAPASSSPCSTTSTSLSSIRSRTRTPRHGSDFTSRSAAERPRSPSTEGPPKREVSYIRPATSISPCDRQSTVS